MHLTNPPPTESVCHRDRLALRLRPPLLSALWPGLLGLPVLLERPLWRRRLQRAPEDVVEGERMEGQRVKALMGLGFFSAFWLLIIAHEASPCPRIRSESAHVSGYQQVATTAVR